jgi:hypothetical protein
MTVLGDCSEFALEVSIERGDLRFAGKLRAMRFLTRGVEARVDVDHAAGVALPLGHTVDLLLDFESEPSRLSVQVHSWARAGKSDSYMLDLQGEDASRLAESLGSRQEARLRGVFGPPVLVLIRAPESQSAERGMLHDVSTGGGAVLVAREPEWLLEPSSNVSLSMQLSPDDSALELTGELRTRRPAGRNVLLGMRWLFEGEAGERVRARLQAHVDAQRAELERRGILKRAS